MIPVAEIFGPTIQGEGPNTGLKTLFVRVAGCDFKCSWCDSKFAWKIDQNTTRYNSRELYSELLKRCVETNTANVVFTGGNPCLYDLGEVIGLLRDEGIGIDIETQGSILPEWLKGVDNLVISPKAPSSGQKDVYETLLKWFTENDITIPRVTFKIPIFNDEDFEFATKYYDLMEKLAWEARTRVKVYLSVGNDNTEEQGDISKRILMNYERLIDKTMASDMKKVYVMPQVHTLVWGNKQGV